MYVIQPVSDLAISRRKCGGATAPECCNETAHRLTPSYLTTALSRARGRPPRALPSLRNPCKLSSECKLDN